MNIDLKNINFAIPNEDSELFNFLISKGYSSLTGKIPVVSTVSDLSYGIAYFVDNEIVFCKHKAVEINKNQKPPRVCTKIQKTFKAISEEDFQKYFRQTNMTEILILEMQEEKNMTKC